MASMPASTGWSSAAECPEKPYRSASTGRDNTAAYKKVRIINRLVIIKVLTVKEKIINCCFHE